MNKFRVTINVLYQYPCCLDLNSFLASMKHQNSALRSTNRHYDYHIQLWHNSLTGLNRYDMWPPHVSDLDHLQK